MTDTAERKTRGATDKREERKKEEQRKIESEKDKKIEIKND